MSTFFSNPWVIGASWVLVVLLTVGNIFFFLKLKSASEQMMKMAFPNAKNMGEALTQMQSMLSGRGSRGPMGGMGANPNMQAQMKMAQDLLRQMSNKR